MNSVNLSSSLLPVFPLLPLLYVVNSWSNGGEVMGKSWSTNNGFPVAGEPSFFSLSFPISDWERKLGSSASFASLQRKYEKAPGKWDSCSQQSVGNKEINGSTTILYLCADRNNPLRNFAGHSMLLQQEHLLHQHLPAKLQP
ncbi:MAG TPA: hypothetical protein VMM58_01075 [Bacteroidota bacterium]|nr:hypothetical protein [Bacteroidota bacterium]